jgi:hypothetical protein
MMDGPVVGRLKKLGEEDSSAEVKSSTPEAPSGIKPSEAPSQKLRLKSKVELDVLDTNESACPECNKGIKEDAVICIQCGFNLKSGKKEKTKASLPSNPNPYQAPSAQLNKKASSQQAYYPGIRRGKYWAYSFLFNLVSTLIAMAAPKLALICSVCLIPISIYLVVQRMKNTGCSGWLAIFVIVPLANIWAAYRLICCQEGYSDADGLDGTGKILVGLFIFLIFGGIAAAFMGATFLQGAF